jgi:hypothetical protein
VVIILAGEETQEAQQLPQNNDNDHQEEEEDNEEEEEEDEDYTPLGYAKKEETYRDADEIKIFGNEDPIPTSRLRDLLNRFDITTPSEFRIKRVLRSGREEYKAVVEILSRPNVLSCHKGPTFTTTYQDAVADAAWQTITAYNRKYHDELKNTVYHMLPQRNKNKFKTFGVKADVPRMLMVHHQDVSMGMSTRLHDTQ